MPDQNEKNRRAREVRVKIGEIIAKSNEGRRRRRIIGRVSVRLK